jgi:16S rRNA (cytosine1402-N4)-methyltransferase
VKLRAVERINQQDQHAGAARERPRMSTTHGGRGRLRPGERRQGEGP